MTKPTEKKVKAWAVIDKERLVIAVRTRPSNANFSIANDGQMALRADVNIVPCTITYSLPKLKKK